MRKFAGTVVLQCFCLLAFSQMPKNADSLAASVEKYLSAVDKKSTQVESLISSKSLKYIKKLKKSEQSLQNIVAKKDSLLALQIFGGVKQQYDAVQGKMKGVEKNLERVTGSYIPLMDSLNTSLKFLKKIDAGKIQQLDGVMENFDRLQSKLNTSLQFENFLKDRQKLVTDKLASFGMLKEFKKYKQQAYYYSQQVREFKDALNKPDKVIATSLQYLQKQFNVEQFISVARRNGRRGVKGFGRTADQDRGAKFDQSTTNWK
jgi:predicted DNA-binding ArsR family transcriptional regulator